MHTNFDTQSAPGTHARFNRATIAGFVVLVLGAILFLTLGLHNTVVPPETLVVAEDQHEQEELAELPVRLIIPAIGVDAEVQYVGLASDGTGEMEVPSNFTDVGWYQDGVRPGMRGSAVIAGHFNGKGVPQAVFYDLDTLRIGDEVAIMSAERVEDVFRVVKIETYEHDDPTTDVFLSSDGKVKLNLITCGGEWLPREDLYEKRTVVFTELVSTTE